MEGIQIRAAELEDSPGLGRVQLDSWRTTTGSELKPQSYWERFSYEQREQAWRGLLASPRPLTALVARNAAGKVVGFAWTAENLKTFPAFRAELCAIHLLPAYRRIGLGRALVGETARRLRERGFGSLLLWTGQRNGPARAFYEKHGGQLLGEQALDLGGFEFVEVAYGWPDIAALCALGVPGS